MSSQTAKLVFFPLINKKNELFFLYFAIILYLCTAFLKSTPCDGELINSLIFNLE
jgi:hypothetical protein